MTVTWAQRRKARLDDLSAGRSLTSEAFRRLRREPSAIAGAARRTASPWAATSSGATSSPG